MANILIVDDEQNSLNALKRMLRNHPLFKDGFLEGCDNGQEALRRLKEGRFDILFCDIRMPGIDGKEVFQRALIEDPGLYIVMMTGYGSIGEAVRYIREGAYDYLGKPFNREDVLSLLNRIRKEMALKAQVRELQLQLSENSRALPFVFRSEDMVRLRESIDAMKDSDFNVLILGESGTGKEVVADTLHYNSPLKEGPFIKVNCAGLVDTLLESEIFGHEKGSFTGAVREKKGKFELARDGTLFLDEIGDMEIGLQAKLLRVLQDGSFERVGGERPLFSNARIISATNHDLERDIDGGHFRKDLYYRLNTVTLSIPPLRKRRSDIPELALFFLNRLNRKYGKAREGWDSDFMEALIHYDYPGNVRELENIITRAFAMAGSDRITLRDLPPDLYELLSGLSPAPAARSLNLKEATEDLERRYIEQAIRSSSGNKTRAAELLGISRRILYYKLEQLGVG